MIQMLLDNYTQTVDLDRSGGNIVDNELLDTAVMISLFTRRRAHDDDVLPSGTDRGGWWGDAFPIVDGDKIGSRLWLLSRSTLSQKTLNLAREYALESLRWFIDDGIASSVNTTPERGDGDVLIIRYEIIKPTKPATKWAGVWQAHLGQL